MKRITALTVLCYLLLIGCGHALINKNVEVEKLIRGLDSTSQEERIHSAEYILKFKIKEQNLNKKVEEILRVGSMKDGNSNHIEEMIWMCKILSALGDNQYIDLFREIALMSPSAKLREYALDSISLSRTNVQRNPLGGFEVLDKQQSALSEMLQSDNIGERRTAAKILTGKVGSHEIDYTAAGKALLAMVDNFQADGIYVDTMAWLCKALGSSGESKYIETLIYVREKTRNRKLIMYASKAIASLSSTVNNGQASLLDKASGHAWYVLSDDSTFNLGSGVKACKTLGRSLIKEMCVPSVDQFNSLWKNYKGSDAIKVFDKKNYLTRKLVNDGCGTQVLEFSFRTGQVGNTYASHLVCITEKCPKRMGTGE